MTVGEIVFFLWIASNIEELYRLQFSVTVPQKLVH